MKHYSNSKETVERQFVAFCKIVLRNEARDIYAARKRNREKFISLSEMSEELCFFDEPEIDFSTLGKEVLVKDILISEALVTLTKRQQDVILHSFFLDKTDKDVGILMGIDNSTVHYHKKRALEALRKFLEEEN